MDKVQAKRELVAAICYADMMDAELAESGMGGEDSDRLAERLIGRAHSLYEAAIRPDCMSHVQYLGLVAGVRRQLTQVRSELRKNQRPPEQADVELMLRATFIEGAGFIPDGLVRAHLARLCDSWAQATA